MGAMKPITGGENKVEPNIGIEPMTYSLRVNCSTPELIRLVTVCCNLLYFLSQKVLQTTILTMFFNGASSLRVTSKTLSSLCLCGFKWFFYSSNYSGHLRTL